ncbi:hypothetical protein QUB56_35115 [Microcoleus sp. AR_TQ3_B6]|uniref:hypothetical protein n=1 Tax=Microcoleus sp. AR_TQ3_B6 TaxID=3055284 RepID=UPI002FD152C4
MQILDGQTASAIYAGKADEDWLTKISNFFDKITAQIGDIIGNIEIGGVKLGDWYAADPVGAAAGVTLGGVVVYLGGQVVGATIGSISSLVAAVRSLGLMGTLRAGATAVLRSVGSRAIYLLGHPGRLATTFLAGITTGAVMRWCAGQAMRLINFNWNETDQQLDAKVKAAERNLWSVSGGTLGTLLGTALCGVVPGAAIVRVNPAKLAAIKEVNQELYEEAMPAVRNLIMATLRVGATKTFIAIYKNSRRILKSLSPVIRRIPLVGETLSSWLDKWGAADSKPWSINIGVQAVIKLIQDENIQEFFEELWEEFLESCTESVFVLSTAFG